MLTRREIMEENEFLRWVHRAKVGSSLVYYTGFLFEDRLPDRAEATRVRRVQVAAQEAYEAREVNLVQRRVLPFVWEYIAQKINPITATVIRAHKNQVWKTGATR